jgi:maltose alpha-D-glucosyltransferase / alpha-amylase
MIETVGTDSHDNPVTYLRSLVEFMGRRRGDAIFLGEANVAPEEQQRYLGMDGGEGVQMLFDFRSCAAQWLSHARGDARPLEEALRSRPRYPQHGQFANFCRHHDELNLGDLAEAERDEIFAAFAPEETHRVYGRGIRRRLAPMLGNDPRRIRLVLALTLALPGTPVLLYGDELGMGEDLSLHGRLAVRSPMQWSARPNGGFSRAGEIYRPMHGDGEYGYRNVNVVDQRHDPESLVAWMTRAIQVRRECPEMGWGEWRILDVGDSRVLALDYRWRDGGVVTLHNLSADDVRVRLPDDLDLTGVEEIRRMFGDGTADHGKEIDLAGYGYSWLRLVDEHVTTAIV